MQRTKFYRNKNIIYYAKEDGTGPDKTAVHFRGYSINDAKRESRQLQKSYLGSGLVRVI